MPAEFISAFILASSVALVFVWLRSACRSILNKPFEQDYAAEVTRAVRFHYLTLRQLLGDEPAGVTDCGSRLAALERDYKALTYLLRKTSTVPDNGYSHAERLLILDFHLLRLWARLKSFLAVNNWRSSLLEMTSILDYFGKVVGQRMHSSVSLFQPRFAMAGEAPVPHLGMCSYCRNVRLPAGSTGEEWVTAQKYYELGGTGSVVLSHGICDQCLQHVVKPLSVAR
ncbi:MAG TPA: hypothetical protein VJ085_08705 [Candidatus Acidoferrales bacterium]|nr:hypothetical protein [Candidatus Acidoferrales bacterium]